MRDDTSRPTPARPGTCLLSSVLAAAGAFAMAAMSSSLRITASSGHGDEALIAWVLVGVAGVGVLLCLYLTVVWALAAAILLVGPASRTGAALLGPLRVLAPRLARRLVTGAAVATAATALTLTSGMASEISSSADSTPDTAPIAQTAQLFSADGPPSDLVPEAAAPGSTGEDPDHANTGALLPPLGWGDGAAPAPTGASSDAADPGSDARDTDSQHTVVVQAGDSLWSISEELLGPVDPDPAEVAAAWPLLHEANRAQVGADPDQLRPGQELTVPTALTHQDVS